MGALLYGTSTYNRRQGSDTDHSRHWTPSYFLPPASTILKPLSPPDHGRRLWTVDGGVWHRHGLELQSLIKAILSRAAYIGHEVMITGAWIPYRGEGESWGTLSLSHRMMPSSSGILGIALAANLRIVVIRLAQGVSLSVLLSPVIALSTYSVITVIA